MNKLEVLVTLIATLGLIWYFRYEWFESKERYDILIGMVINTKLMDIESREHIEVQTVIKSYRLMENHSGIIINDKYVLSIGYVERILNDKI